MILDTLNNLELYAKMDENFKQVAEYVKKTDLRSLEIGRYELENGVYLMVQNYCTKPVAEGKYEVHRKYTDIQIVLEGKENMGYAPITAMEALNEYNEDNDCQFLQGSGNLLEVHADSFAIFFPQDAHMPGVGEQACEVKKIVVKVPVA